MTKVTEFFHAVRNAHVADTISGTWIRTKLYNQVSYLLRLRNEPALHLFRFIQAIPGYGVLLQSPVSEYTYLLDFRERVAILIQMPPGRYLIPADYEPLLENSHS